uniref:MarR family transcriptional regulator n=1 Tax=Thermus islandicus TaxID=540988 RepID=A0A7C2GFJ0_9DEIN
MNGPPAPAVKELAQLAYALMHALFQEAKEAFAAEGLSLQQAHALALVAQGVGLPSALAACLEVRPSQVSHLLAALEGAGLLERAPDPKDRRRVHLRLTPQGAAAHERTAAAWLRVFARRLARLGPEELDTFLRLMRKLAEAERA